MERSEEFARVKEIAEAICDGDVTDEQKEELQKLIFDDPAAQQFYIEYMDMLARLKADSPDNVFELTMRRMQVEEITLRSGGEVEIRKSTAPVTSEFISGSGSPARQIDGTVQTSRNPFLLIIVILLLLIVSALLVRQFTDKPEAGWAGTIKSGEIRQLALNKTLSSGNGLVPGKYESMAEASIELDGVINFTAHSSFEIDFDLLRLERGSFSYSQEQNSKLAVEINGTKIKADGGTYQIILTNTGHELTVKKGSVSIIPRLWRPRHFWNFDTASDRISDSIGEAHGIPGTGVKPVKGIVGKQAVSFDNSEDAHIHVGSGGGTVPGTGSFSVNEGITIEALIIPQWSGEELDYDEIFRKDYDQAYRMLFSFQNDYNKNQNYSFPKSAPGPRLAFGLFLVGQKYQELELLLDGKEGRPSLADLKDGKAHHTVASYNSFTGRKAIHIDGEMVCHVDYPKGTRIISGGPGPTTIGNMPGKTNTEPFTGVIDEAAFYNFALTSKEIKTHYENVQKGLTYFGYSPESSVKPQEQSREIKLKEGDSVIIDPQTGLLK